MKGFIYLWINRVNGKKYIGRHKGDENDPYVGSGKYFRRAYKKYGRENFERIILEHIDDCGEDDLLIKDREQYFLDLFDASKNPEYYNISPSSHGGTHGQDQFGPNNGMWRRKHRPESIEKMRRPGERNGMYGVSRFGQENPMYGKAHNAETRKKLSLALSNQKKHTCPYCGTTAIGGNYARWHGDKCRKKNDVLGVQP